MDIQDLLQNVVMFTIGTGLVTYLIKKIFSQYFEKDVEKFKHELMQDQIRFSKLHEKRAEIINELYGKIVDLESNMKSYINLINLIQVVGESSYPEKQKKAGESGKEFLDFYAKNDIYFSSDVCKKIDIINDTFLKAWNEFEIYKPYESNRGINENEKSDAWHKSWDIISKEIPPIKEELKKEFRNMLGVK
ncbi:MAG: hypothetical protein WA139_01925 [Candidatus Aenigmatarchaeota archaeon]